MRTFLDRLANAEPAPGGGAAAAASGAIGVALLSMALRLTLAKKIDAALRAELAALLAACEALRARLAGFVDIDGRAVRLLIDAYRMPADAAGRADAVEAAMRGAVQAPLDCAACCLEAIRLAGRCIEACHRNVAGDAAAGMLALQAAVRICALNVSINSPALRDAAFGRRARESATAMLGEATPLAESALRRVSERLNAKGE
ncbi:MAG TPA: cyclodeaminase/cyclohydrolase family protein [Steroidobacteraceae bacterium]|nr:cyclodeaminase/cyclohydrolase family protein [Steroidobacteraceae bacterium]